MGAQDRQAAPRFFSFFLLHSVTMQRIVALTFFLLFVQVFEFHGLEVHADDGQDELKQIKKKQKVSNDNDPCLKDEYATDNYPDCCAQGGYKIGDRSSVCKRVAREAKKRMEL